MKSAAYNLAAIITGGGGSGDGSEEIDAVNTSTVAQDVPSLGNNQWPWLLVAVVVGYLLQRNSRGFAFGNVLGWILIIGSILILVASLFGLGNAMNFFGDIFIGVGDAFQWFGGSLKNSA